ncbi:hypothetical protein [Geomonas agri]|uniref:hypothetical protein n=1 Tax=Geomonas agri TaxID=2873702 RepID=UPI001CD59FE7|nr:hypothetical protein [Geomonas agri]
MMRLFATFACLLLFFGCDYIERLTSNIDVTKIQAFPSKIESGIVFGVSGETATAQIESVSIECIPTTNVIDTKHSEQTYDIAVTSMVNYKFNREVYAPYYCDMIFEAKSKSGVVLGTATGTAKLLNSSTIATVSGKISGISRGAMEKVSYVVARWDYSN